MTDNLCGAILRLDETDRYCEDLARRGIEPLFADAQGSLEDWAEEQWKVVGKSFLWDAEIAIFGKSLPTWVQRFGTCFPAGSKVLMADGTERSIELIRPGDTVITHTGKRRKVLDTGCRTYSGNLKTIRCVGATLPVTMTDEHPVAVYGTRHKKLTGLTWKSANSVGRGDHVLYPFPQTDESGHEYSCGNRQIAIDEQMGRLLGLYAAEGSMEYYRGRPSRLTWTFCGDEMRFANEVAAILSDVFGAESRIIDERPRKNVIRVRCQDRNVARAFHDTIPGKSLTKSVPDMIFSSPFGVRVAFLRGWLDGDGHAKIRSRGGNAIASEVIIGVSSSMSLATGVCRLATSCGLIPHFGIRKRYAHQNAAATTVSFYGEQACRIFPWMREKTGRKFSESPKGSKARIVPGGVARRVSDVSSMYVENIPVYNLEVEEEHSYIVGGMAVHNCVGQGHGRAQQDSWFYTLAFGDGVGYPAMLAWEPIYGKSRTLPGTQRFRGDGSSGVYAAQAVHDYGMVCRGSYGTVELNTNREDLARTWADNGVPKVVLDAMSLHKAQACMRCMTTTDVRNAILAGYGVARCADRATGVSRDANGMARVVQSGGHCQCLRGVFKDHKGRTCFVEQQSWPEGACPSGGGPLKLYDGTTKDLPQGAAGIYEEDVDYYCKRGEVWAVASPKTGWVADLKPSEVK